MCRHCWVITVKGILNGKHSDSKEARSFKDVALGKTEGTVRLMESSILMCTTEMTLIGTIS